MTILITRWSKHSFWCTVVLLVYTYRLQIFGRLKGEGGILQLEAGFQKFRGTQQEHLSKILEILSPVFQIDLWPFENIFVETNAVWSVRRLSWKWKFSPKALGNGTFFPEFTSCRWLYENASWLCLTFLTRYLICPSENETEESVFHR